MSFQNSGAVWFFFFSSRRRHTRFDSDWSSDVCSSDLPTRTVSIRSMAASLGMFFLPQSAPARDAAIDLIETVLVGLGMSVLGWRVVPVDATEIGRASCRERV